MYIEISPIIRRLKGVKIPPKHAEAIASEINIAYNPRLAEELLQTKIAQLSAQFDRKLEAVKTELLKWFIGVGLFQTTALIITMISAFINKNS